MTPTQARALADDQRDRREWTIADALDSLADQVEALQELALAVSAGAYGVACRDVGGVNWFDARDAVIDRAREAT